MMSRLRLISIFALIMVLLNGILLFKLTQSDKKDQPGTAHTGKERPKDMIVRELGFDDSQTAKFEELIKEHRRESKRINDLLRDNRETYYGTLKDEVGANEKDLLELNEVMAQLHKEMNELNYEHFKDIKNLCTAEQKEKFKAFLDKLSRRMMGPPPPRHRGRPGGPGGPPPHGPPH